MDKKRKSDVRAPVTNTGKYRKTPGGSVSFEAYFLRDLYRKGKIDDSLISELCKAEKIEGSPKDIIRILADTEGGNIPRGLASAIASLAQVVADQN